MMQKLQVPSEDICRRLQKKSPHGGAKKKLNQKTELRRKDFFLHKLQDQWKQAKRVWTRAQLKSDNFQSFGRDNM